MHYKVNLLHAQKCCESSNSCRHSIFANHHMTRATAQCCVLIRSHLVSVCLFEQTTEVVNEILHAQKGCESSNSCRHSIFANHHMTRATAGIPEQCYILTRPSLVSIDNVCMI